MIKHRKDLTLFKKFLLDNFGFVAQLKDLKFPFKIEGIDTVNAESSLSYISFQSEKDV